ncbi:MAG: ACT domain-containing protein [Henriciella sp.]|nr:ACT domain-containing protein [Henriciella sp.]
MAEKDLPKLLTTLRVQRRAGVWRYESIPPEQSSWVDLVNLRDVGEIALLFREQEGLTVITKAAEDTPEDNRWAWLELSVYSDLQAVGFLARVATALAEADVPCNAVAAFHHDHVFVPIGKADRAVQALEKLAQESP